MAHNEVYLRCASFSSRPAPMAILSRLASVSMPMAVLSRPMAVLSCQCKGETLRESAQPTSLESRVAPGVMEYARSPKLPPLVFEAQTCGLCGGPRQSCLSLLPYVGPGWYLKGSLAAIARVAQRGLHFLPDPLRHLLLRRWAGCLVMASLARSPAATDDHRHVDQVLVSPCPAWSAPAGSARASSARCAAGCSRWAPRG